MTLPRITVPIALLVSLGIILLAAAILFAMGRDPICKCGYVQFWQGVDSKSQHLFDWYSFTHMLHGPVFYLLIWLIDRGRLSVAQRLVVAVFLEAGWEIIENTQFVINRYRRTSPEYSGDSIVNSIGDLAAMVVGFLITSRLPAWITAILFVAAEVTLYLRIEDSFVLNFLRLVGVI